MFSKIAGYKINTQKESIAFLQKWHAHKEMRETVPFTTASKKFLNKSNQRSELYNEKLRHQQKKKITEDGIFHTY